ncbi:MAG: kelch repeat-containing protein [Myxococcota bacterium]
MDTRARREPGARSRGVSTWVGLLACALGAGPLAGCLQSGATRCGALLCPPGLVCSHSEDRCVFPEQNNACIGLEDGDVCVFGVSDGICDRGTCVDFRCGNGVVDPGEACDDGNGRSGDGCSGDCASDETCGNGIQDGAAGEMCDDGNIIDGDECQSNCARPRCGDGIVDVDEACDDGNFDEVDGCNGRCTSDETCGNGVIDVVAGEACDDGNFVAGDTCGPTCQIEFCGNGLLDPGEVCDDGNNQNGDGCSGACNSTEMCGNGALDPLGAEVCDDGNLRSFDACSSRCKIEFPNWDPAGRNPARRFGEMVYDGNRGALLLVGGERGAREAAMQSDVRIRGSWARLQRESRETFSVGHVAVFDAARQHVLFVGGRAPSGFDGGMRREGRLRMRTYLLQGATWNESSPLPARAYAAGAYDVANERVVIFGGEDGDLLNETWVHNGSDWSQLTPSTSPSARAHHGMAYDVRRQVVVLYGGEAADGSALRDTWEFDGTAWSQVASDGPSIEGRLVYDIAGERMLLFGGSGRRASDALWSYDVAGWTRIMDEGPEPRLGAAVAYEPEIGGLVVRGGGDRAPGDSFEDTWLYRDGWTEISSRRTPEARRTPAGVYDPRDENIHVFGGEFMGPRRDAWTFTSTGYVPQRRLPFGSLVTDAAYDRARRQIVVVTGDVRADDTLHTWIQDGRRWRELPIVGPPMRTHSALAYDSEREVVLLYGGRNGDENFNDLWAFDGAWRQVMATSPPPATRGPSIAYDEARNVLFCIPRASGRLTEIWELRGERWQLSGEPLPQPAALIRYYPQAETTWMISSTPPLSSVWSRNDDGTWTPVRVTTQFRARQGPFAVMNLSERSLVAGLGDPSPETRILQFETLDGVELCTDADADRDGDGVSQCDDPDCAGQICGSAGERCIEGACQCEYATEVSCVDGYDDDCDGQIDCDDSDCTATAHCMSELDCNNGIDDDGDGLVDCADPGCLASATCEAVESRCDDGFDNDGDGRVDCQDPKCFLRPCVSVDES